MKYTDLVKKADLDSGRIGWGALGGLGGATGAYLLGRLLHGKRKKGLPWLYAMLGGLGGFAGAYSLSSPTATVTGKDVETDTDASVFDNAVSKLKDQFGNDRVTVTRDSDGKTVVKYKDNDKRVSKLVNDVGTKLNAAHALLSTGVRAGKNYGAHFESEINYNNARLKALEDLRKVKPELFSLVDQPRKFVWYQPSSWIGSEPAPAPKGHPKVPGALPPEDPKITIEKTLQADKELAKLDKLRTENSIGSATRHTVAPLWKNLVAQAGVKLTGAATQYGFDKWQTESARDAFQRMLDRQE